MEKHRFLPFLLILALFAIVPSTINASRIVKRSPTDYKELCRIVCGEEFEVQGDIDPEEDDKDTFDKLCSSCQEMFPDGYDARRRRVQRQAACDKKTKRRSFRNMLRRNLPMRRKLARRKSLRRMANRRLKNV